MHIAVIIPYCPQATHETLRWTLEGFAQQELASGQSLEILVGLDGGTEPLALPNLPASPHAPVVHGLPRIGAAAVRNELVQRVQCIPDLLIFANADTRPAVDMVRQHAAKMTTLPDRSLVLGAAPWERCNSTVLDTLIDETPMIFSYCHLQADRGYTFRVAYSLNLSVRYGDFVAAGGFPEAVRPYYYEDLAFAARVLGTKQAGVFFAPQARVLHRHPMTLAQYLDREELLGMMAPVLEKAAPETFTALMAGRTAAAITADFQAKLMGDKSLFPPLFQRLQEQFAQPVGVLGQGEARRQAIQRLYQLHLPLKLLAFRLGFLQGMQWLSDKDWFQRRPHSRWRPWVEPALSGG
jgi:hypothetical protein